MRIVLVLFILTFTLPGSFAQNSPGGDFGLRFGANFRIYPGNLDQTEVFIAKSPLDENILFAACNTLNFSPFFISEGIYVSTDGGFTWTGNDTCTGTPIAFHGGDPGITIDKNGTFILTRMGRSPFIGLYSHYSLDNGQTWSSQKVISTDDLERAAVSTDLNPVSPFYGRTYAAWVKFAMPFPLMFAYTDDGAKTWANPIPVNNPSSRSAGGDIAMGPGGEVYVCWAGVQDVTPFKEILVGFASSNNGGVIWNVTENAFPMSGINGELTDKNKIRVNGLPSIACDTTQGPRRGWIYIVSGQKGLLPAGSDPDIIMNRSTDGGQTWSQAIRVNQDPLNNGKIQYFPSMHIDKYGAINIIFYDDRNTTSDSAGVFLARSVDGGDSWTEFEISDHNYKPVSIGGLGQGYQGDNIDLTSTSTGLIPVWMDNSSGEYQIWTVPIDFSDINDIGELQRPNSHGSLQIYPNPFKNSTKITFTMASPSLVSLKIFDMLGNELAELIHGSRHPGNHMIDFNRSASPGSKSFKDGVYIIKLSLGDRVESKKMILIR